MGTAMARRALVIAVGAMALAGVPASWARAPAGGIFTTAAVPGAVIAAAPGVSRPGEIEARPAGTVPAALAWHAMPVISSHYGSLYAVAATSARDAWAVGYGANGTLAVHWNGNSWKQVRSPESHPRRQLLRRCRDLCPQRLGRRRDRQRRRQPDRALERELLEAHPQPGSCHRRPALRRGRHLRP